MTPPLDFEAAKQKVAKRHKEVIAFFKYLASMEDIPDFNKFFAEAAELYADSRSRKAANEAVKADRETIRKECVESCWLKEPGWDSGDEFLVLDEVKFESLPLPFPEESL
jgi:hypothetical protein